MKAWINKDIDTGIHRIPARSCVLIDEDQGGTYLRDNFGLLRVIWRGMKFLVSMEFLDGEPIWS